MEGGPPDSLRESFLGSSYLWVPPSSGLPSTMLIWGLGPRGGTAREPEEALGSAGGY